MNDTQSPLASAFGGGPLAAYRALIEGGSLSADDAQRLAAERLQDLWVKLRGYDPPLKPQGFSLSERVLHHVAQFLVIVVQQRGLGRNLVGELGDRTIAVEIPAHARHVAAAVQNRRLARRNFRRNRRRRSVAHRPRCKCETPVHRQPSPLMRRILDRTNVDLIVPGLGSRSFLVGQGVAADQKHRIPPDRNLRGRSQGEQAQTFRVRRH